MGTFTTNIIRNVYNVGGNNSCDSGSQYCQDGYGLYFPCLKEITRGQDACFEFYVVDYNTKGVVDLRDVDAISLDLNGSFGCSFGTFSYPDNISSLQTEKYNELYINNFGARRLCHIELASIDATNQNDDLYMNLKNGDFYTGIMVEMSAYDTKTHIFIGWALMNLDEGCDEDRWEDYIFSTENTYTHIVSDDVLIVALYRPRRKYSIVADVESNKCIFKVDYNHIKHLVGNAPDEKLDDGFDEVIDVIEGYHMVATCIPAIWYDTDGSESEDETYTYMFNHWKDGDGNRTRLFTIGKDTKPFEFGDVIKLSAICSGKIQEYELIDQDIMYMDKFDEDGIHINTKFNSITEFEYYGDEYTKDIDNVTLKFIDEEGFLRFNNGRLAMTSMNIEDGIKISISAKTDAYCELAVENNGLVMLQEVSGDGFKMYEFYFHKCNGEDIIISTNGECLIDAIFIYDEEIIDKGKASLCLDAETTSGIPTGNLSVSGAIMVNDKSYGISNAQIGKINNLKKISILKL